MLVLLTNDAACRIFDRVSNQLLQCDLTTNKLRHPLQAAFSFPTEESADYLDCSFSPNGCLIAKCEKSSNILLRSMEKVLREPDMRTVVGLTLMSATSCLLNINNEDALARSWQLTETQTPQDLLIELFTAINVNFEFVSDESQQQRVQSFLLNPILTKALSMLESLDVPKDGRQSIPSKTASTLLEIRALCMTIQFNISTTPDPNQPIG